MQKSLQLAQVLVVLKLDTYLVDEWLIDASLIVEHQKRNVVAQNVVAILVYRRKHESRIQKKDESSLVRGNESYSVSAKRIIPVSAISSSFGSY